MKNRVISYDENPPGSHFIDILLTMGQQLGKLLDLTWWSRFFVQADVL